MVKHLITNASIGLSETSSEPTTLKSESQVQNLTKCQPYL